MSLKLKSSKLRKLVVLLTAGLLLGVSLFFIGSGNVWSEYDFRVLDFFYRQAVKHGYGPEASTIPQVVYLTITDGSYNYFGKNYLDRRDMARVNNALAQLGVEAVGYDVIFARPSNPEADRAFTESLENLGTAYLPIGFAISEKPRPFRWEEGSAYERFRSDYLRTPVEKGTPQPYHAVAALMQYDDFSDAAWNSGHISAYADPDSVYRHILMLLKVDDRYFPTLGLSMFLDWAYVPFEEMAVEWGQRIVIPATKDSYLEEDVVIPIDEQGLTFVPFVNVMKKDFKAMPVHDLLRNFQDEDLRGNLMDFFEGNFVLVGDVAVGTSDLGHTPLESDVPLVNLHASMLNALLTNTFYTKWPLWHVVGLIGIIGLMVGVAALPRASSFLYSMGFVIIAALVVLTWWEFIHFRLFPILTVGVSSLVIFFGLISCLEVAQSKDRAFIRNAFAQYVPEKVVNEMLANPESLRLGGEERTITVLFSDLANFTTISENMTPPELAHLLNEYLTEMTNLVLAHGGIIDKYEGDAIMAEFGAPLSMPDHADQAVLAGLKMQRRLVELRRIWAEKDLPDMRCRVGINTGPMIVGNMGSHQVFDFTVIGDHVNLASRLEGANKRYNTYLMISEFTREAVTKGRFRTRVLDVIKVKGKSEAVKVFEVYGDDTEPVDERDETYYRTYHEAFENYLARSFSTARDLFQKALDLRPQDPASREMINRIDALNPDELPDDWDGSIALTTK